ncbi:MAG: alcohol dehydrogenase catalytic domain-containing protein [Treponema sp.]|jgi:L-iditol 2-dehydrogenase|nr:alcohol dehydrogenase catalytic domain-containing protein [Treponema sp.]
MGLPKTMKALVAYSQTDYRFVPDFPVPECGPDDIILKTEGCGICAGDLKCRHGAAMFWGGGIQSGYVKPPFIPGHEFLGTVAAVGSSVKAYSTGDRLTADQIVPCGECRFCKSGRYWMCQTHEIFGFFSNLNGGMAEYVRLPKNSVISRVPKDLPLKPALLIEPYGCSKHCVDRAQIGCEDIVVISGAGTLGLGMVTYARMKNPAKLISLDMQDNRLEKAKEFGADITWNPGKVNIADEIMKMTDGYGCDSYIEATGHPSSVVQGMQIIRKLGRFVEFSVFAAPTELDWSIIGDRKELDVLGSHLSPYCFPFVIKNIASGKLKTDGVVSRLFKLEEWEKAFEYAAGTQGDLKVAFSFA